MIRTKGEGVRAADSAIASYRQQAGELGAEAEAIAQHRQEASDQYTATLENLAVGLVPSPDRAVVIQAGAETGAVHLERRLNEIEQHRQNAIDRVSAIAADPRFVNRDELVHPTEGKYSVEIARLQRAVDESKESLRRFEIREFHWLRHRNVHEDREFGAFDRFWRTMTFAGMREEKAMAKVLDQLGHATFDQCVQDHEDLSEKSRRAEAALEKQTASRQAVLDLAEEHAELTNWINDYAHQATLGLRHTLVEHLHGADMEAIHQVIRPAFRVLVAKCHALEQKQRYYDDMTNFLHEEVDDRRQRVVSISRVRNTWARKPFDRVRGDKTKWLVTVPQMKHTSTRKRIGWTRSMHHNIHSYDRYDAYDHLMHSGCGFLPYDAFGWQADERMPYEGFSRSVIPELNEYRETHGMEKADYSPFENIEDIEEDAMEVIDAEVVSDELLSEEEKRKEQLEDSIDDASDHRDGAETNSSDHADASTGQVSDGGAGVGLGAGIAAAALAADMLMDESDGSSEFADMS